MFESINVNRSELISKCVKFQVILFKWFLQQRVTDSQSVIGIKKMESKNKKTKKIKKLERTHQKD